MKIALKNSALREGVWSLKTNIVMPLFLGKWSVMYRILWVSDFERIFGWIIKILRRIGVLFCFPFLQWKHIAEGLFFNKDREIKLDTLWKYKICHLSQSKRKYLCYNSINMRIMVIYYTIISTSTLSFFSYIYS